MFFNNDIKKCKVLGKFAIDIEKEQAKGTKIVKKLIETDNYIFYIYNNPKVEYDSFYILRQNKDNRKYIVSFGFIADKFLDFFSIFDNNLVFAVGGTPEIGAWDYFQFIDILTGERRRVGLRSEYGNMEFIAGYGRVYNQDKIKNMYNKNGNLVVEFYRKKSYDKKAENAMYNEDMEYVLTLTVNNNKISASRSYEKNI